MADLGVEVKLEPKLNQSEFEAAVKGLKLQLPIEVNTKTLASSINSAIDGVKAHKLKISVDTSYLNKQISTILQSQLGNASQINQRLKRQMSTGQSVTTGSNIDNQLNLTRSTKKWNMLGVGTAESLHKAQAQIDKMKSSVENLNLKGAFNTDELQKLNNDFENTVDKFERAKFYTKGFQQELDSTTAAYKKLTNEQKKSSASNIGERRIQRETQHLANIQRQARELIENNPRVLNTSLYGQLNDIIGKASSGAGNSVELSRDLANVRSEMERLGVTSENVGQRISRLFRDHFNTAIAMAGLHLLQNSLQEIVTSVIDVDTAMTDLQKVSNATSAEYASFLEGAEGRAKSLGATITDVIGATSEFSRLGYNLDESSTLGDAAVKYLNVSEYTNIEDAAQSLVSTMQAFNIEADQVGSIVDKFNEIGNNYAISLIIGLRSSKDVRKKSH